MTYSLSARLLMMLIAVVLGTVVVTALLTSRITSDWIGAQYEKGVNTEEPIIGGLMDFGRSHDSWDDVEATVADLSEQYGYPIVMVSESGRILAGSGDASVDEDVIAEEPAITIPPLWQIPLSVGESVGRDRPHLVAAGDAESVAVYIGTGDDFNPFADGTWWWRIGIAAVAVLAVVVAIAFYVGGRITRPIRTVIAAVRQMSSGSRGARVYAQGHDDVAELGRAFNEMSEAVELGEKQRKTMVSDVAHELRSPLANIHGYLEATEDGVVPLDSQLIATLHRESEHLLRLVDDLQDLALADAGELSVHLEECDVVDVAEQVLAAIRQRSADAEVTVMLEAPPTAVVEADPVRLRQALGNLVENAVQYSPKLETVAVDVQVDGSDVCVTVSDAGPGIATENLGRVFDRFFRTDPSRSRSSGGSGLGLAIARQAVVAMGGTIDVASEYGHGATFTIRLPRRPGRVLSNFAAQTVE